MPATSPRNKPSAIAPLVMVEPLFVDMETVLAMVPVSESTIELEVREGRFPARRKISGRRTGWLYAEVKAWAAARPISDLPPPPNTGRDKGNEEGPTPS